MTRNNRHNILSTAWQQSCSWCVAVIGHTRVLSVVFFVTLLFTLACEREPELHLHEGGKPIEFELPIINLDLDVYWNYEFDYGVAYDWRAEWYYGWDDIDQQIFGNLGYTEPHVFHVRRYHTYRDPAAPHTMMLAALHDHFLAV